ncbi:MAG: ABC transporter permease [Candidatus Heimdallarchaeota archaeon]
MSLIKNFTSGRVNSANLFSNYQVTKQVFLARLRTFARYRGQVIMSIITPVMVASLPILMGVALSGSAENAQTNFKAITGTGNYIGYMLVGTLFFNLVSNSFWNFGYWLRREQMQGTLETLYASPINRIWLLVGTSTYVMVRNSFIFFAAMILGIIVFGLPLQVFLQPTLILALFIYCIGMIPLFGLSLIFGAVVLRVKEVDSLINVTTFLLSFLLGMFFPVTVLPVLLQIISLTIPVTWVTNSIRAVLFDANYFLSFYLDLGVIILFALFAPLFALRLFTGVEKGMQKQEGFSSY